MIDLMIKCFWFLLPAYFANMAPVTVKKISFYNNGIFNEFFIVDYSNWLLLGLLMGFGAIIGDSFKSFFKRRLGYEPGQRFIPFDQTDFVIGALIFTYFIVKPNLEFVITALILSFVLHIIVNHISFYTGIRKEKW